MSLKARSGLREAFLTFIFLTIAALIEIGLRWEQQYGERRFIVEYANSELTYMLNLNESQARQVSQINYTFYDRISEVYLVSFLDSNVFSDEMNTIMEARDLTIMKLLSKQQKDVWKNLKDEHPKKEKR
jgi:hypothetical protein